MRALAQDHAEPVYGCGTRKPAAGCAAGHVDQKELASGEPFPGQLLAYCRPVFSAETCSESPVRSKL
ncbi:hypothetical protein SAMN06265370_10746 [Puniceibacterium sediminis]|uniref:Uncharacterized protein n=1 Tax=Puniceibacterium sediminis TaxID=1608407 RepID=A0A238WRY3_9RHOB|nr:hypothetical protein SAMN06265370_10746 [Puniceibacterium sediminis]